MPSDDEEEDRIQIVVDGIPFNIWVTGPDGGQRFVNRTYREFFGVDEQGAIGDRWQELIRPEDLKPYTEKFLPAWPNGNRSIPNYV